MYLKSLSVRGFKSFADKVVLLFEPGISVIVGPNGSGKSNLIDAILWVLGEQSPHSLRGGAMEDVIFAGSSSRAPLGVAEASLTLDNSDGFLPIDFSEVCISRRIYRSGESDYFLNGSPCRLLDIQELLSDSGISQRLHTIVGQGQMEEIINSKPEERRVLIEEVAGIFKYRRRKEKALKKLSSIDEKLVRLKDIIYELNRQLKPLQEQASKAERFQKIQDELRNLQVGLAVSRLRAFQKEWQRLKENQKNKEKEYLSSKKALERNIKWIESLQVELEKKGLFVGDLTEKKEKLRSIYDRLNSGLLLLEEKGKNLVEKLSEIRRKIYQVDMGKRANEERLSAIRGEKATIDNHLADIHQALADLRRRSEQIKKDRKQIEEEEKLLERKIRLARENLREKRQLFEERGLERVKLESNLTFLDWQKNELKKKEKEILSRLKEIESEEAKLKINLDKMRKSFSSFDKEEEVTQEKISLEKEKREKLEKEQDEINFQKRALETEAKFPFEVPEFNNLNTLGFLSDFLEISPGYERFVEIFLSDYFFSLLVGKGSEVKTIFSKLKKAETFLSLFSLEKIKENVASLKINPGFPLRDVVKAKGEAKKVVDFLFKDVFLVDDFKVALKLAKTYPEATFVSKDGMVVYPHGLFRLDTRRGGGLITKRKIALELNSKEASLRAEINHCEEEIARLVKWKKNIESKKDNLLKNLREEEGKIHFLRAEKVQLEERLGELNQKLEEISKEIKEESLKLEEEKKNLARSREGIALMEKNLIEIEALRAKLGKRKEEKIEEEGKISQEISDCQVEMATLIEKQGFFKKELISLEKEIQEGENFLLTEGKIVDSLERLKDRIEPLNKVYLQHLEFVEEKLSFLENLKEIEKDKVFNVKDKIVQLQEECKAQSDLIEKLQQEMEEAKILKVQLEEKVSSVARKILDEFNLPVETALEKYSNFELREEVCEERIKKLKADMESIGQVNPLAIKEYSSLLERKKFLSDQINDLEEGKKAIGTIVRAIDRKIKEKFLEAFEKLNQNFQEVFLSLFPSGKAELILVPSDDPLEAGVEIIAQPQGKKLKRMSLLSGGERALVALSLLFAFHFTSPSPFYILDEVEPSLDDLNLQRFINLLKKIKEEAQILIVTHQRRTMEIGDIIYGVSMQADGVSKVFSQKMLYLEEAQGY